MSDALPLVSVIMPVRNEADFIERSLGAVLDQDYPHDRMEVFVADGLSNDGTVDLVHQLASQSDIQVNIVENPRRIVPTGFNAALECARGDIVIRIDGHTEIASDYVRTCVDTLERTGAQNVGGRMNAHGRGLFGKAVAAATSTPFGVGGARFHYSRHEEAVDTVYLGAWPRTVFDELGGFDKELVRNQDDEFNYRLRASGGIIVLNPAIRSVYYNRSTFRGLVRQYFQYGLYKVRVMQKHPRQMQARQFAPPMFVAVVLGGALLSPFSTTIRTIWVVTLATYAAANLLASVLTAARFGWRYLPLLPIVFGSLHISYGAGFLKGLWVFCGRWSTRRIDGE